MNSASKLPLILVDEEDSEEMSDVTVIMTQAELRAMLEVEIAIARRERDVYMRPTVQMAAVHIA